MKEAWQQQLAMNRPIEEVRHPPKLGSLAVFLVETPSDYYCLTRCCTIPVLLCVVTLVCCGALFPAKSIVPPIPAHLIDVFE